MGMEHYYQFSIYYAIIYALTHPPYFIFFGPLCKNGKLKST